MSINDVKEKVKPNRTKWDEAICDAKKRIRALQSTIAFYRQRKKAGDQWPGDSAAPMKAGDPWPGESATQ
jgi:hypothetical protein